MQDYKHICVLSMICFTLIVFPFMNLVKADNVNPILYSTDSSPYGVPYKIWTEKFWQWKFNLPEPKNPLRTYTPENCQNGQQGPVWFLAELLTGKQERTCTMPAGKSIFLPILTGQCDMSDKSLHNDQELRQCAVEGQDYGTIAASIDGLPVRNLESYRISSGFFNLNVPANNIFNESPAGVYRAFVDGWFLFLQPLPPGTHNIHYTVSILNPIKPQYNFAADLTYRLLIK
jgi:hypothetical protein